MRNIDKLADEWTTHVDDADQFHDERLVAYRRDAWPSRIDSAALDVLFGVAIGTADGPDDFGATIGRENFGDATGTHYVTGLAELADEHSDLPSLLGRYERAHGDAAVGDLAFRLNELRYELERHLSSENEIRNLNRAVEVLIDKIATASISGTVARQPLHRPESVTDAMLQLFSDPAITEYADALAETMDELAQQESFLERLDAPHMTTRLWDHQREALRAWVDHGCKGYVDMATATGKTVLGLAAIAALYGQLHPDDAAAIAQDDDETGDADEHEETDEFIEFDVHDVHNDAAEYDDTNDYGGFFDVHDETTERDTFDLHDDSDLQDDATEHDEFDRQDDATEHDESDRHDDTEPDRADDADRLSVDERETNARVLVVAGQELILEQWQSEFDEHLNIPRERTQAEGRTMSFTWGSIEFRTAQDLLGMETLGGYDLVVLDEAHRYSRGKEGSGWRRVLDELATKSDAILAMSGSIDTSWQGDTAVKQTLEEHLYECKRFSVDDARTAGVIANFSWNVFYAHAAKSESLEGLVQSTRSIDAVYDGERHKIRVDDLDGDLPDGTPEAFETLTDLRSFSQSNAGADARNASQAFDDLATDVFTRGPKRWQLHPPVDTLVSLVDRHAPAQQCVVLVQSYKQAERVGEALTDRFDSDLVQVLDSDATDGFAQIEAFKSREDGVIVGPADVIGIGIDLPNAEVAINLSKGGVNSSLIQRIGRVLRDPTGDKEATFYQVVTLPSDRRALLPGEDGRRLLRRASEFRALGARLRQLPGYDVEAGSTVETLDTLEREGADAVTQDDRPIDAIVEDEVAQAFLEKLRRSISVASEHDEDRQPFLLTFNGGRIDRHARPVAEAVKPHSPFIGTASTHDHARSVGGATDTSQLTLTNPHRIELEVSPALHRVLELELESRDDSLDTLVDDLVGTHVATQLDDDDSTVSSTPADDVDVTVPPSLATVIDAELATEDESIEEFVREAIHERLGLQPGAQTLDIGLSGGLRRIVETVVETTESYDSVEELVEEAITVHLSR